MEARTISQNLQENSGNTYVLLGVRSQFCQMLAVIQCEEKMDICRWLICFVFLTSKGVESETVISSHAQQENKMGKYLYEFQVT